MAQDKGRPQFLQLHTAATGLERHRVGVGSGRAGRRPESPLPSSVLGVLIDRAQPRHPMPASTLAQIPRAARPHHIHPGEPGTPMRRSPAPTHTHLNVGGSGGQGGEHREREAAPRSGLACGFDPDMASATSSSWHHSAEGRGAQGLSSKGQLGHPRRQEGTGGDTL